MMARKGTIMKRTGLALLIGSASILAIGATLAAPKKAPPPPKGAPKDAKDAKDAKADPNAKKAPSMNTVDWWNSPTTGKPTWVRPAQLPPGEEGELVKYGMELTKNTYKLLGPTSPKPYFQKRHNCTNCHLDMGQSANASPWVVAGLKFAGDGLYQPREGHKVTIASRVAECFRRTLGGTPLPPDSREEKAFEAYLKWLATGITAPKSPPAKKGQPQQPDWMNVVGLGTPDVPLLDRAADPVRGKAVFMKMCSPCHGEDGQGTFDKAKDRIIFPPLWGPQAFGESAGMSMLPFAVKFIKANMPYGFANATDPNRQLPLEDAWDVASFIVTQPRSPFPDKDKDWSGFGPDCMPNWLNKNPAAGFGPYFPRVKPDGTLTGDLKYPAKYSEKQHTYGPFKEIVADMKKLKEEYLKHPNKGPNCPPWPPEK